MSGALTIFDCDGVLVDSERACNRVLADALAELGVDLDIETCMARFVGKSMATVEAEVAAEFGVTFPPDWPHSVRMRTIAALQHQSVPEIPGVRAVLEAHRRAGRRYCVASSGRVEKMQATLGGAGLLPLVGEVLFSATLVGRGKPAPDLFLHAAGAMGVAPGDCTVIEDSLPGVQAAVAAGMPVRAYCAAPYAQADAYRALGAGIFTEMAELPQILGLG